MQRPALDAPASEWLVYADALQVAGDPRGELITLVHHGDEQARDTYVHKHAPSLLGPAAKPFRKNTYRLTWRHCVIDKAEVRLTSEDHGAHAVRSILEAPAASELTEIAIVGVTDNYRPVDLTNAIAALDGPLPPSCTSVAIVDERATRARTQIARDHGVDENLVRFTTLAPIWKQPFDHVRLELADAHKLDFTGLDAKRLRSFTFRTLRTLVDDWDGGASELAIALGVSEWGCLEELELRLAETFTANIPLERAPYVPVYSIPNEEDDRDATEAYDGGSVGISYLSLEPLFGRLARAPLRRMAITSFDNADSLFEVLGRTGLPPTLRVLDLSDSALHERHVAWMRANARLFAPLTHLILERTALADVRGLEGLGPAIVHSHEPAAPTYRYVVGME